MNQHIRQKNHFNFITLLLSTNIKLKTKRK